MYHTYRVRLGLVAVASLLGLIVFIRPGHSQPYPPGGFRGGPGVPGTTVPGPPGGMPGPPGGFRGGPPAMPSPPVNPPMPPPAPPRFGPPPGFGTGGGIGGPTIYTWNCGQCGRVLGTGPHPPAMAYCPGCRANNIIPGTGGAGVAAPGSSPPPSADSSGLSPSRHRVVWVILVTLGVLVLLGVGIGAIIVTLVKSQPERPRRRRRRYDD